MSTDGNTVYKVRPLNLLDIREMAKILKEAELSKMDFSSVVGGIFDQAAKLSEDGSSENINAFITAAMPAVDMVFDLLSKSDTFWYFFASLLSIEYEELFNISFFEIKGILSSLANDEQVRAFFTSTSKPASKKAK